MRFYILILPLFCLNLAAQEAPISSFVENSMPVKTESPAPAIVTQSTEPVITQSTTSLPAEEIKPKIKKEFSLEPKKIPMSGIVLTPTAYRSNAQNSIGMALDFNASYYIGRLYGKNKFSWTKTKSNYLDRVGVWLLETDGKMLIQTEGAYRPAIASGVKGIFKFRDSAQPSLNSPSVSVKVDDKNTETYAAAYLSATKSLHPRFFINAGYTDGDMPKVIYQLSEFLSSQALGLEGYNKPKIPDTAFYGGMIWLFKEKTPIEFEIIIPQGGPLNPKLINLQLGNLLKLNFQISYLTYKGGWEYLGMFNFRYSYFPRRNK